MDDNHRTLWTRIAAASGAAAIGLAGYGAMYVRTSKSEDHETRDHYYHIASHYQARGDVDYDVN